MSGDNSRDVFWLCRAIHTREPQQDYTRRCQMLMYYKIAEVVIFCDNDGPYV